MINREHDLPITKQALVLRISRGSVYYLTRPMPEADLAIMRRLDRLHLEFPFAGSRMLQGLLVAEGCKIGRRHVKTLMQRMGIEGAASNTRRCICEATTASARLALRSANTSLSTTVGGPTRALTARHPIKLTSPRCHSAWQPNPGRGSTYRRGKTVQTTGATSVSARMRSPSDCR